jgi:hypothetical protein
MFGARERGHGQAQRPCQPVAVGPRCTGGQAAIRVEERRAAFQRIDAVSSSVLGVCGRVGIGRAASSFRGRVVGGRSARHQRQAGGEAVRNEQAQKCTFALRCVSAVDAQHQQAVNALVEPTAGGQRQAQRHAVLQRGFEVAEPVHGVVGRCGVR